MNISHFFVRRPVFAAVLSILITLLGLVSVRTLPVALYPEVVPPTIEVRATYPGASAETVAETVAAPIEQEVNGVENMLYMNSVSGNDGSMTLTVTFKLGTDIDDAQVLTQNRVTIAQAKLPEDVRKLGVVTKKKSPNILMVASVYCPDGTLDQLYVSNYVTLRVKDALARIDGVGDVSVFGAQDYSMRVWLDPDRLAARGLTASDVVRAIREQNQQVVAGQVGAPPVPSGQSFQLTALARGRLADPAEFAGIVVRRGAAGELVRVRDVGRVELGSKSYTQESRLAGRPAQNVAIYQLPGANALEVAGRVRETMRELARDFPAGLAYEIPFDTTGYIEKSIETVEHTLLEAVGLVVLVVLLFLQSWRTALIPVLAIPVSLIGTFAAMAAFGFTVNNLSLFGLVLAIGIVVDDAIVVVENVERNIALGLAPRDATFRAMDEVGGALVSIGLVLVSVFVPVAFLPGIAGQFYRQFALTIAVSTALSVLVSLTLSPALAALLLRPHGAARDLLTRLLDLVLGPVFRVFNAGFDALTRFYGAAVARSIRVAAFGLVLYVGLIALTGQAFRVTPTGFIPDQDQGYLMANIQLPDAASLERTGAAVRAFSEIARSTEGVATTIEIVGFSIVSGANLSNCATVFLPLTPFEERARRGLNARVVAAELGRRAAAIQEAHVAVFGPPPIIGLGTGSGFKMLVQDRVGLGPDALQEMAGTVARAANSSGAVARAFTTFRAATPQLELDIDRVQAKTLGVDLTELFTTLQVFMGGLYVNDLTLLGRNFQVNAQADAAFRTDADRIRGLKVRKSDGTMVPLGTLLRVRDRTGPAALTRFNMFPAADVSGQAAPGRSSGDALGAMETVCRQTLPGGAGFEWTDMAWQERRAGSPVAIFVLVVAFVFLLLAAQYESWTLPLAILLIVPMCMLSAMAGVLARAMDNNLFTQIGLVVLIGLAAKNAILIVEFARDLRARGRTIHDATIEACRLRLRPILMTSFAFIAGVFPLVVRAGAGAEMRQALGTAVFFGMLGVTLFGVFFTPLFYSILQTLTEKVRPRPDQAAPPAAPLSTAPTPPTP